ncbi:hypothetical protein E4U41_001647 [Claviceps citrina]|nr:hypothetical protein E4U41_001647 [Claviceps citrina]
MEQENLKPASPPKTNPWTTKRRTTALSSDWPSITENFPTINSQDNKNDAVTCKDEAATKQDEDDSSQSTGGKPQDTCPKSKKAPQEAKPRPGISLWLHPFGADVIVRAGLETFHVHREIVEPQSSYFQRYLPPRKDPNLWEHDPIVMLLNLHPEAVANTLRFMYTETLEVCEYNRESPRDLTHIPGSVLLYIAAMDLGVDAMKTKILELLQQTTKDLALYFQHKTLAQAMNPREVVEGVSHLHNALEAAYSSEHFDDMLPLRLALCQLVDTLLPFLIQHPVMIDLFYSVVWQTYAADISADLLAARSSDKAG